MFHIGIDLGSMKSQICIRAQDGKIQWEGMVPTEDIPRRLKKYPMSRVILETCAEAFKIADLLREDNHEVRVVQSTLVRQLGVGAHGIKTDRRDAEALSIVSCRIDLPSVHIRSVEARLLKSRLGMRKGLVEARTKLINTVRGYLRTELKRVGSGSSKCFPQRVRKVLLEDPCGLSDFVEHTLLAIEAMTEQIQQLDKSLETLAKANPICQRLQTVPGVGVMTSLAFIYAVDDITRFPNAHQLESYLGLTPGERSSSQRQRRLGITKAGPACVRYLLSQAAWSVWSRDLRQRRQQKLSTPIDPLIVWAEAMVKSRFVCKIEKHLHHHYAAFCSVSSFLIRVISKYRRFAHLAAT